MLHLISIVTALALTEIDECKIGANGVGVCVVDGVESNTPYTTGTFTATGATQTITGILSAASG